VNPLAVTLEADEHGLSLAVPGDGVSSELPLTAEAEYVAACYLRANMEPEFMDEMRGWLYAIKADA
jgi:hypothetical protein